MKCRVIKPLENFHQKVYQETTSDINKLMECMINRAKLAQAQKAAAAAAQAEEGKMDIQ